MRERLLPAITEGVGLDCLVKITEMNIQGYRKQGVEMPICRSLRCVRETMKDFQYEMFGISIRAEACIAKKNYSRILNHRSGKTKMAVPGTTVYEYLIEFFLSLTG